MRTPNIARTVFLTGAAALLTLAGCQRADKQVMPEASHYYLNDQPSTRQAVEEVPATDIDRVDVLSGQRARNYAHDSAATGVVIVKTKAK